MIRPLRPLLLLWTLAAFGAGAADELAPAVECSPRAGLPNFFAKLDTRGAEVRIAYLGGSITAQEGWRPKTLAYFQKTYPDARLSPINAAIGGTGSDLGVFRLKHDVLDQRPDLVFVEFAVNDGGQAPERIHRQMEGIVRQTWRAYPSCDICFVYTVTDTLIPPLYDGKFPRAASAMEKVAAHYGIPSIHLAIDVAKQAKEGKLLLKAKKPTTDEERAAVGDKILFAPDGVHPYPETGHEMYLQAILRSLPKIRAASARPAAHGLAAPFTPDNFENAKMVPIDRAALSPGVVKLDPAKDVFAKRFADRVPALYRAARPGDAITFRFKGRHAAIYDLLAPDAGQVRVTVDDSPPVVRPRFDAYCTYARLGTLAVASDLPDAVHTVRIEVLPDPLDKAKILAQRNERMDDPKRFEGLAFYPGAILVDGDLVTE
jgi:lysophospholipase L1-like esterase